MSDADCLDEILSEAELVLYEHGIKVKSRNISESNVNYEDILTNGLSNSDWIPSPIKKLTGLQRIEDVSTVELNDQVQNSTSVSVFTPNQLKSQGICEELKELCWQLLSVASLSLRDYSRAASYITRLQKTCGDYMKGALFLDEDTEKKRCQISEASSRIQHLLVEVGHIDSHSKSLEEETARLCSLLSSLVKSVNESLKSAQLSHLVDDGVISPRRSSVGRLVESASSGLLLLQQKMNQSKEIENHLLQRLEKLEHLVKCADQKNDELAKKLLSHERSVQEGNSETEAQKQRLYLELAKAEGQYTLLQQEYKSYRLSCEEQEQKLNNETVKLRSHLADSHLKLQERTDSLREISARYKKLGEEYQSKVEDLEKALTELKTENTRLQRESEEQFSANSQTVLAVKGEKGKLMKEVQMLKGEITSCKEHCTKLEEERNESRSEEEKSKKSLSDMRLRLSDMRSEHQEEVKALEEKNSQMSSQLVESQSLVRKEHLLNVQLQTKVQMESQRASDLKLQTTTLYKQIENLNKNLQDQIERRLREEISTINKSLSDSRCNATQISEQIIEKLSNRDEKNLSTFNLNDTASFVSPKRRSIISAPSEDNEGYLQSSRTFQRGLQELHAIEKSMSDMVLRDIESDCSPLKRSYDEEKDGNGKERTEKFSSNNSRLPQLPSKTVNRTPNESTSNNTYKDSGFSSSASFSSSELMTAREEARKERIEAAKLREKCALLKIEVDSQKEELEEQKRRSLLKNRSDRAKREKFGQILGCLEESFETCSNYDVTGEDFSGVLEQNAATNDVNEVLSDS